MFEYYSVVLDAAVGRYSPAHAEGGAGQQTFYEVFKQGTFIVAFYLL